MRFLRMVAIVAASAALGLLLLWSVGPHSKPGSANHGPQDLVFFGVVGVCLLSTRHAWARRVSD